MLTFGSLFSGFGGMDLGLEQAGLKCLWQVESNDYARRVLEKHWPGMQRHDDVRTFPGPGNWEYPDLLAGGDPCQRNSAAAGPSPSRAESFGDEFLRVVAHFRPWLVLRENPSLIKRDAPWPWWRFRSGLESLGYTVLPFRLRACCLGADHRRERLFLLAENANANRFGMEGRDCQDSREVKQTTPATSLGPASWDDIRSMPGYRSRAGLPGYVERITGLGNAVCPIVAKYIGHLIISSLNKPSARLLIAARALTNGERG